MLFSNMKRAGINVEEMDKVDIASVVEAIRSLLSAHYGIYHPFQRLTAELFRISESGVPPAIETAMPEVTRAERPCTYSVGSRFGAASGTASSRLK